MTRVDWFNHEDATEAITSIQQAGRRAHAGRLDEALVELEAARKRLAKYRSKIRAAWRRREKKAGNWCADCGRRSQGAKVHRRSCPRNVATAHEGSGLST